MQRQYKIMAQTIASSMSLDTVWIGRVRGNEYVPPPFAYFFDYRELTRYGVNNAIFFQTKVR